MSESVSTAASGNAQFVFGCRHMGQMCRLSLTGCSADDPIGHQLHQQRLVWTYNSSNRQSGSLQLSQVLNASTPTDSFASNYTLELIVAKRLHGKEALWSLNRLLFTDMPDAAKCSRLLLDRLKLFRRPTTLLLFINPTSGGGGAEALAKRLVLPWLDACGVRAVTVLTERRYHARDYLLRECLTPFDGIVCVGGDGILSELMHGLLLRRRLDLGIDGHSKLDAEHPADKPIGVIPSGSTDAIVHSINNNTDPTTALVHILLGNRVAMDVTSVYDMHTGDFLAYNLGLLSYGYFGDICKGSESMRWLGPMRYDLMGALTLMRLPRHLLEVTLIESEPVRQPTVCHRRCLVCAQPPNPDVSREAVRDLGPPASNKTDPICCQPVSSLPSNGNAYAWRQTRRRYASVSSFTMPCRSAKSPHGAVPYGHLANGLADFVAVPGRSRLHFLHYLIRLTCRPAWLLKSEKDFDLSSSSSSLTSSSSNIYEGVETQFQLDSVTARRVSAFSVRVLRNHHCGGASQSSSAWNSDGELLRSSDIICRVNPRLLILFGSHIDQQQAQSAEFNSKTERRFACCQIDPLLCCVSI